MVAQTTSGGVMRIEGPKRGFFLSEGLFTWIKIAMSDDESAGDYELS